MNRLKRLGAVALLAGGPSYAQAPRWSSAEEYLTRALGFSAAEVASVARGETVVRHLSGRAERDVAMVAAVNVGVPRSYFVERQRDFAHALHGTFQLFSTPAGLGDVSRVEISDGDVQSLANCHPNDCDFKLPAAAMAEGRSLAAGPNATSRIAAYVRDRMVAYVNDYRRRGDSALVVYDDHNAVPASGAFDAMFRDWAPVYDGLSSVRAMVSNIAPADDGADVIFWTIDHISGVRPTLRILHAVLYSPSEFALASAVVRRQLYANHYLEAGLELLVAVQRPSQAAITLIALRRYRFDNLPAGVLRRRVTAGLEANMQGELQRLKRDYEAAQ